MIDLTTMNFNKDVMGHVFYDADAKEFVLITNGKCVMAHDNAAAYKSSHEQPIGTIRPCVYTPSEAIALRPFLHGDGSVDVAWTYRGVRAEALSQPAGGADAEASIKVQFDLALGRVKPSRAKPMADKSKPSTQVLDTPAPGVRYIGRV